MAKALCGKGWKRTLLWLSILPSLLLAIDVTDQRGLPTTGGIISAIATSAVLLVGAILLGAVRLTFDES
ncbi:MAG TPA: hypothetical protein VLF64_01195 [Candidatus Saccharimonadales bacterium]|nr:hypothetical protein [Candidatus Saccharimonadales bacterium]